MFQQPSIFDGPFLHGGDDRRLKTQLDRTLHAMRDGRPRTLTEIAALVGGSETSVSARIRDLRKKRFGGYDVETVRDGNRYTYRLVKAGA